MEVPALPAPESRLRSYYRFDDAVVEAVTEVAAEQNRYSFRELADRYGLSEGPKQYVPATSRPYSYLHFVPQQAYDTTEARLYMAPMATPPDANMAMRGMRLFAADPSRQLVVAGAPAALGNRTNRPALHEVPTIWRGSLEPLVQPALGHLEHMGVQRADIIGYSYGAEAAATASGMAAQHGVETVRGVYIEPVAVVRRGLVRLAKAFAASGEPLPAYVAATASGPLEEARAEATVGTIRYTGGLLRLSNIAIAHALAGRQFLERAASGLEQQPHSRAILAWGSKSELAPNGALWTVQQQLEHRYPGRVRGMRLHGMHHAGGDDIDLHAAIVLQALRR